MIASPLRSLFVALLMTSGLPAAEESALLVSQSGGTAPAAAAPLTLTIGINDIYCAKTACECIGEIATRSYDGTIAALAKAGIRLEITYFMDEMDLQKAIKARRLQGVICKPWQALGLAEQAGSDFKRVADLTDPDGSSNLTGVILVPKDSPIRTLADLGGKHLVFGQPDSYEKYHAPLQLLSAGKIKPASAIYLSSCGENLDKLMDGAVDAAVISDYALTASCAADFAKPEDFRTIATTPPTPLTSVLLDLKKVPAADAARLQRALLAIAGANVPDDLLGKGFVAPVSWKPAPADPASAPPKPADSKP